MGGEDRGGDRTDRRADAGRRPSPTARTGRKGYTQKAIRRRPQGPYLRTGEYERRQTGRDSSSTLHKKAPAFRANDEQFRHRHFRCGRNTACRWEEIPSRRSPSPSRAVGRRRSNSVIKMSTSILDYILRTGGVLPQPQRPCPCDAARPDAGQPGRGQQRRQSAQHGAVVERFTKAAAYVRSNLPVLKAAGSSVAATRRSPPPPVEQSASIVTMEAQSLVHEFDERTAISGGADDKAMRATPAANAAISPWSGTAPPQMQHLRRDVWGARDG